MNIQINIKMNKKLFLRNPDSSELGKKIIGHSIDLIHKIGFENFTFKKLAKDIDSTEAGIYRYFENKHKVLLYLSAWYWSWLEYQITIQTKYITDHKAKLKLIIELLTSSLKEKSDSEFINEKKLHQIIITEGSKTYLTHEVLKNNKDKLFKPYKDLCATIASVICMANPDYKYPKTLVSSIIEISHFQNFFMTYLPALTDFKEGREEENIIEFIKDLVFSSLNLS